MTSFNYHLFLEAFGGATLAYMAVSAVQQVFYKFGYARGKAEALKAQAK